VAVKRSVTPSVGGREVRRGTTPCRVVLAYTVGRASGADALAFLGFALLTMHIMRDSHPKVKTISRLHIFSTIQKQDPQMENPPCGGFPRERGEH